MKPLLAYLIVRLAEDRWEVASYRDLDGLVSAWKEFGNPEAAGVVHVGFWRPLTRAFEQALARCPGTVLLSESAKSALPSSFKSASTPCAIVDGLRLYEAFTGWGYERDESEQPWIVEQGLIPASGAIGDLPHPPDPQCAWLVLTKARDAALWRAAAAAGITDEASYVAKEVLLKVPDRNALAVLRFSFMSGSEPSESTIIQNLAFAPPWLLALDVRALGLSTRPTNRLTEEKLASVAEIASFGEARLMKIPNMGRGSVLQIARSLLEAFSRGSAFCSAHSITSDRPSHISAVDSVATSLAPQKDIFDSWDDAPYNFATAIEETLKVVDARQGKILRLRMGLDGAPRTLEAVGEAFGVTRERVRQIEAKALQRIAFMMPPKRIGMEARLDRLLEGRLDPLPIVGLEVLDQWFMGAAEMMDAFGYSLVHFTTEQRHWLLKIDGQVYVTGINDETWSEAVQKAKALLVNHLREGKGLAESDARYLVDSLLVGRGEDLRPLLWNATTRWANFSAGPGGERLLASFGFGAESVVEAVLLESDRPLHYEEIAKRCIERGRVVEVRNAHRSAARVGTLMAPGVYGLEKHIPLTDDECRTVLSEAENMLSENASKQWHASEICDGLEERGLDFGGRLSKYVVNFVLRSSKHLVYLRRLIWAVKSTGSRSAADRIEVWQAMASMLKEYGGPMTTEEIRSRLSRDRGIGDTFQLHERDPVVRVGVGTWGLLWRDIPFSEDDAQRIVAEMEEVMLATGRGLHIMEICAALRRTSIVASKATDPVLLLSLARRAGRVKVDKGGYIYLSDWESSRRLSAIEAVTATLAELDGKGATLTEIATRASGLTGRQIASSMASRMLITAGAVYDADSMRWARPETSEPDPSEDASKEDYAEDLPPSDASLPLDAPTAQGV